ncbi:MAG: ABC transporter permease [Gemmatimonadota bacterium]|nr:ABC transporter permease [Gemmatimonadota bacterium]
MDSLLADVRYALRGLRRTPAFAAAAIACLAIGIGANATMFGVVDALLFRPPAHVRDAKSVYNFKITRTLPGIGQNTQLEMTYPDYLDFREHTASFASIAAYAEQELTLGRGADAQQLRAHMVSASFLPLLGVQPAAGRFFTADEDKVGNAQVVVLDYGFWQRRFAGERSAIGSQIRLANEMYTVIGVTPKGFTGVGLAASDVWLPLAAAASNNIMGPEFLTSRGFFFLSAVARVKAGVTLAQASGDATRAHRAGRAESAQGRREDPNASVSLGSIVGVGADDERSTADLKVTISLAAVAAVVLLIACANVANLLLTRALRRQREIAIRLALGVSRARLVRQLVTESVILAVTGGVAGMLVAHWGGGVIRRFLLPGIAALDAPLDARVLLFTLAATVVTGLLCGLAPAIQGSRPDLTSSLKAGAREGTFARSRLRSALIAGQVALTLVLLVGAGLFVRSLQNVRGSDLGFDVDKLVLASVDLGGAGYTKEQSTQFYNRAQERIAALPGVASVSQVVSVPFQSMIAVMLFIPGRDSLPRSMSNPLMNPVTSEYFQTTGTRLVRGRAFTAAEQATSANVVVVNEALAKLYWPGENPLGTCLKIGQGRKANRDSLPCSEIIGIARNATSQELREKPVPQYYVPMPNQPRWGMRSLFVRAKGDPALQVATIRKTLQELGSDLPYASVRPMSELLDPQVRPWRLGAMMFGIFGSVALVLAIVGLYGVLAYTVAQRTQEIGVRIALGAQRGDVVRLVVGEGVRVAVIGVAVGAIAALGAGRAIRALLFDVSATDPLIFTLTALALVTVAAGASYLPARRAAKVDPAVALRSE